ncbi:hypothetical protein ACH5RR_039480 [Cinchona calisaya]|uniref:Uncharacterized protein n=1 Tax=Cinchona calisaya TaxID=153742 RepID=A0ABD2Y3G3_9GENT
MGCREWRRWVVEGVVGLGFGRSRGGTRAGDGEFGVVAMDEKKEEMEFKDEIMGKMGGAVGMGRVVGEGSCWVVLGSDGGWHTWTLGEGNGGGLGWLHGRAKEDSDHASKDLKSARTEVEHHKFEAKKLRSELNLLRTERVELEAKLPLDSVNNVLLSSALQTTS